MSEQRRVTVTVSRKYTATAERVFDAWLDPQKARQFLFTDDTQSVIKAEMDARVGGSFLFVTLRSGTEWDHIGKFIEIDRPRRLVFDFLVPKATLEESRVTITITPLESGCELTLVHEGLRPDLEQPVITGWTTYLANLESYCAADDDHPTV